MKFDAWTTQVLKNFAAMNPGVTIKPGVTQSTIADPSRRAFAIAKLKQEFPEACSIADLGGLESALRMFKDPEIEFGEKSLTVSDGDRKLEYGYAAEDVIAAPPGKAINVKQDIQFALPWATFSEVLKAAGALGQPQVAFVGDGTRLVLQTWNSDKPSRTAFKVRLGESTQKFSVVFKTEDVKFIPKDYAVTISFDKIALFYDEDIQYFVGADESSKVPAR